MLGLKFHHQTRVVDMVMTPRRDLSIPVESFEALCADVHEKDINPFSLHFLMNI